MAKTELPRELSRVAARDLCACCHSEYPVDCHACECHECEHRSQCLVPGVYECPPTLSAFTPGPPTTAWLIARTKEALRAHMLSRRRGEGRHRGVRGSDSTQAQEARRIDRMMDKSMNITTKTTKAELTDEIFRQNKEIVVTASARDACARHVTDLLEQVRQLTITKQALTTVKAAAEMEVAVLKRLIIEGLRG